MFDPQRSKQPEHDRSQPEPALEPSKTKRHTGDLTRIPLYTQLAWGNQPPPWLRLPMQRKESHEEEALQERDEPSTQRKENMTDLPNSLPGENQLQSRIQAARSNGHHLDKQIQQRLEQGLDADLSRVQVHTDSEADHLSRSVRALAFTTGSDIFFRSGIYNPHSSQGLHLLAHEATHVVQQTMGPVEGIPRTIGVSINEPGDRFEQAAEAKAVRITGGKEDTSPIKEMHPASIPSRTQQVIQRWDDPDTQEEVDLKTVSLDKLLKYSNHTKLSTEQKQECLAEYSSRMQKRNTRRLAPKPPTANPPTTKSHRPEADEVLNESAAKSHRPDTEKGRVLSPRPKASPRPKVPPPPVLAPPQVLENGPIDNILGIIYYPRLAASGNVSATGVLKDIKRQAEPNLTQALNDIPVQVDNLKYGGVSLDGDAIAAVATAFLGKKVGLSEGAIQANNLAFNNIQVSLVYRGPTYKQNQQAHQANLEITVNSQQVINYHIDWNKQ